MLMMTVLMIMLLLSNDSNSVRWSANELRVAAAEVLNFNA